MRGMHLGFIAGPGAILYSFSRDVTYAVFCQGPNEESARYRDFMGWEIPWYSAPLDSLEKLLVGRRVGMMHIVCYLRQGSKVFETYWTTRRGVEAMDNSYRLLDLTVYGWQETWEDSPTGWPRGKEWTRTNGRPTAQWSRLKAGYSDDLGSGGRQLEIRPAHIATQPLFATNPPAPPTAAAVTQRQWQQRRRESVSPYY